jgi:hypothetical protein
VDVLREKIMVNMSLAFEKISFEGKQVLKKYDDITFYTKRIMKGRKLIFNAASAIEISRQEKLKPKPEESQSLVKRANIRSKSRKVMYTIKTVDIDEELSKQKKNAEELSKLGI